MNESIFEDAALEWFVELGYPVVHDSHLTPVEPTAELGSFFKVALSGELRVTSLEQDLEEASA